jgi:hypothetical protein
LADAEEAEAEAEADAEVMPALTFALLSEFDAEAEAEAEAEADTLVELTLALALLLLAVLALTGKTSGIPSLTSNQNLPIPVSFLMMAWKKKTFGTVLMESNIWPLAGKPCVARNWQVARVHEVLEELAEEEVQ